MCNSNVSFWLKVCGKEAVQFESLDALEEYALKLPYMDLVWSRVWSEGDYSLTPQVTPEFLESRKIKQRTLV